MIGFDLGSHVAHFAGMRYKYHVERATDWEYPRTIDRITAFDPPIYLFEFDGISKSDAYYVDVYHTNPISPSSYTMKTYSSASDIDIVVRSRTFISNLKERRFGDPRDIGHADFYINIVDEESMRAYHPQCHADVKSPAYFGCYSAISGRIFLDSVMNGNITQFSFPDIGIFGIDMNTDTEGKFYIKYEYAICSVGNDIPMEPLPAMFELSDEEYDKLIGFEMPIGFQRRFSRFPIDPPKQIDRQNEPVKDCGEYADISGRSDTQSDIGGRIWEGNPLYSKNHFPWTVCIKDETILLFKYLYIVVDNLLCDRPMSMRYAQTYSRKERLSVMLRTGEKVLRTKKFTQSCTGSLISDSWILTAGHCRYGYINEADIMVSYDTLCGYGDKVRIEMEDNPDRTIFVPKVLDDAEDIAFDDWVENNLGLLTIEQESIASAPMSTKKRFMEYTHQQMLDHINRSGQKPKCVLESKLYPDIVSLSQSKDPLRTGADIALIKLPKKLTAGKICFASSVGIKMLEFNQHFYHAAYGTKGTIDDRQQRDTSLSWLSLLSVQEMERRKMNITHFILPLGLTYDNVHFHHIANVDFVGGHLVTSSTCPGDSGGPVFVYGYATVAKTFFSKKNITYAIQVGVVSGGYEGVSIELSIF